MMAPSTPSGTSPRIATTSSSVDTPPGGDDRAVGAGAHVAQQGEVGALEHAVLGDVGDDVAGAPLGVEAGQGLPEVTALAGPAAGGERRAAHVEADRHPVAVLGDGPGGPLRVLERGGAEVDPAAAGGQRPLERLGVTDAAAHLHVDVEGARRCGRAARRSSRARRRRRGRRGAATPSPAPARPAPPRPGRRTRHRCRRRPARAARPGPRRRRRRAAAAGGAGSGRLTVGPPGSGSSGSGAQVVAGAATSAPDAGRDPVCRAPGHAVASGSSPGTRRPDGTRSTNRSKLPKRIRGQIDLLVTAGTGRGSRGATGQRERTQLRSRARPASPDFSGWNWVADERAVLDGGHEPLAVGGPGDQRLDRGEGPSDGASSQSCAA